MTTINQGTIENILALGGILRHDVSKKAYGFDYIENGNHHSCVAVSYTDVKGNVSGAVSMGNIHFKWDVDSWGVLTRDFDPEYFKIFIEMLKVVKSDLDIELPESSLR